MKKNREENSILKFFGVLVVSICVAASVVFGCGLVLKPQNSGFSAGFANAEDVLKPLIDDVSESDASYDLTKIYPILPENQTNSDLCWIYASMKSLETTLMVATDEYYDFSETATALMAYYDGTSQLINSMGNFEKFNVVAQKYGLVYESEFSNDLYFDLTEQNSSNFDYVLKLASSDTLNLVKPVAFANSSSFANNVTLAKTEVVKKFIKRYGGVFVGIEWGAINKQSTGGYVYIKGTEENKNQLQQISDGKYFSKGHSVCVVGWDENGFIALNSWGIESSSCTYFYIPFDYEYLYTQIYGYVFDGSPKVTLSNSTAASFSQNVIKSEKITKNMFGANDTLSLEYKVDDSVNFSNTYVKILKGQQDVTSRFVVTYKEAEAKIEISSKFDDFTSFGGTYLIRVYEDINLIAVKNFSIVMGTEVAYFKLVKSDVNETVDSYAMFNAFESSNYVTTFYISAIQSYNLNFYLNEFNKYTNTNVSPNITISKVFVYSTQNGEVLQTSSSSLRFTTNRNNQSNRYQIAIRGLSAYAGQRIEFELTIGSTLYSGYSQVYHINLFVSEIGTINTGSTHSVIYELNGGQNSAYNPTKLPNYSIDNSMTSIELYAPTKNGFDFMGWYLDKGYTQPITKITNQNAQDLVLYARWQDQETRYFNTDIKLSEIVSYSGDSSPYVQGQTITYGESVKLKYQFVEEDVLAGYNYSLKFYAYVNGIEFASQDLIKGTQTHMVNFNFPDFVAGHYDIEVLTAVVISHETSETSTNTLSFDIAQKPIEVVFDNHKLQKVYNKTAYNPKEIDGAIAILGVYAEDLAGFDYELSDGAKTDFGSYRYYVSSINDSNYSFDASVFGVLFIDKKEISVVWGDNSYAYTSNYHSATYTLSGVIDGDGVELILDGGVQKDVGVHNVVVTGLTNSNYILKENTETTLQIQPATIVVTFENVTERLQTAPNNRKQVRFSLTSGIIYDNDDINDIIVVDCEGLTTSKSGNYTISGHSSSVNYHVIVNTATYILTGHYYVYYTLPNGEIYTEIVPDGENPKGINGDIYPKGAFCGYTYSQKLENINQDLYIIVTITNYTWVFIMVVIVVLFGGTYWFITRKQRRNKVK